MRTITGIIFLLFAATAVFSAYGQGNALEKERSIRLSIEINASVERVWNQWTSPEGIRRFFAPASRVEFKPLGRFDVYFFPNAPEGEKGAEGNFFMAIEPMKMISFTWDAPSDWMEIRKQRTLVVLRFSAVAKNKTQVTLTQTGWGTSPEWNEVHCYFENAWGKVVLPNLKYSVEVGPIDWRDFPSRLPKGLRPAVIL